VSGLPAPSDAQRCVAIASHGSRCKNYKLPGIDTCGSHATDPKHKSIVQRDPRQAALMKAQKQKEKRQAAEDREHVRSLSLRDQMRVRLEEKAALVVDTIEQLLRDPDPAIRLRALDHWQQRVYGKPLQPTVNASVGNVDNGTVNELRAALDALTPEARAELARKQLGLQKGGDS